MKPDQIETLAGHPTRIRRLGNGPRQVLALHCSLAHGGAWGALALDLAEEVTLITLDFPGHGASPAPADMSDFHALSTRMAIELAERIAGGAPVDIIGHSFGGTVAIRLALARPDLVASLCLVEPVLFAAARATAQEKLAGWIEEQRIVDELIAQGDKFRAAQVFHATWGHGLPLERMPAAQQSYISERVHFIPAATDVLWHDAAGLAAEGALERITAPTLLVEGSASPPIVAAVNEALLARIPNVQALKVQGAGHMVPLTHPQIVAEAFAAHLGIKAVQP